MSSKTRPWKRVEFWSAVGLVLFFFFPWVSIGGIISLTGYQVGDAVRQGSHVAQQFDGSPAPQTFQQILKEKSKTIESIVIYLIPVVGLIGAIVDLTSAKKRPVMMYFIAAVLPFVALALALIDSGSDLFQILSIGAWLTFIAGIGCGVGLFLKQTEATPVPNATVATAD